MKFNLHKDSLSEMYVKHKKQMKIGSNRFVVVNRNLCDVL